MAELDCHDPDCPCLHYLVQQSFGERCPDFDPECPVCAAYHEADMVWTFPEYEYLIDPLADWYAAAIKNPDIDNRRPIQ